MTRHDKRLSELCIIANDTSEFQKNRHAAAIYIGSKLISIGVNQLKSHPLQAKFGINSDAIFLHAEIDAIRNALKRVTPLDLQGATLYVARTKNGIVKMSKPCNGCQRAIMHFNIPNVYWTE
jgi:deoxycytidylate deaminase